MTPRYSIDPADTDGGMTTAAIETEANDSFSTAARAEAEERFLDNGHTWAGTNSALGFREGAAWARDHLAGQEPTEDAVQAAARVLLADYQTQYDGGHPVDFTDLARAVLITAARTARRGDA